MNRIRDLREDRDLRQIDVANGINIDQKTLSNYETGKTLPDSDTLIKLADFFKVSIDYLVGRTCNNFYSNYEIIKKLDSIRDDLDEIKKSISY